MAPFLQAAFTLLKVWKLAVWNGLVSALVVVGQEVFTNYAFRCPCIHGHNIAIVVVVFVVPAVVFTCLGFLLQTDTWKAVTGCYPGGDAVYCQWWKTSCLCRKINALCKCCSKDAKTPEEQRPFLLQLLPAGAGGAASPTGAGGATSPTGAGGAASPTEGAATPAGAGGAASPTGAGGAASTTGAGGATSPTGAGGAAGRSCHCSRRCFGPMLAKALIPPIVWVSVALLTGDYVACAHSGNTWAGKDLLDEELNVPEVLARIPCLNIPLHANISDGIARQIREKTIYSLHTVSQYCGFGLIGFSILVGTLIVCCNRCCSNKSLKEKLFRDQYQQVERKVFKEQAEAFITEYAKKDAKNFFEMIGEQCSADGSITNLESFHKTWADISKPGEFSDDKHFSRLQVYAKSITSQAPQQPQLPPQQRQSPQLPPQQP